MIGDLLKIKERNYLEIDLGLYAPVEDISYKFSLPSFSLVKCDKPYYVRIENIENSIKLGSGYSDLVNGKEEKITIYANQDILRNEIFEKYKNCNNLKEVGFFCNTFGKLIQCLEEKEKHFKVQKLLNHKVNISNILRDIKEFQNG